MNKPVKINNLLKKHKEITKQISLCSFDKNKQSGRLTIELDKVEKKLTEITPINKKELLTKIHFTEKIITPLMKNKRDIFNKLILGIFKDIKNHLKKEE